MIKNIVEISIKEQNGQQLVSARELHKALDMKRRFSLWIEQYTKEGNKWDFEVDTHFTMGVLTSTPYNKYGGEQELDDMYLVVRMAKEISMLTDTQAGSLCRKYFLALEDECQILHLENSALKDEIIEHQRIELTIANDTVGILNDSERCGVDEKIILEKKYKRINSEVRKQLKNAKEKSKIFEIMCAELRNYIRRELNAKVPSELE